MDKQLLRDGMVEWLYMRGRDGEGRPLQPKSQGGGKGVEGAIPKTGLNK
jgi:hypothetical protein